MDQIEFINNMEKISTKYLCRSQNSVIVVIAQCVHKKPADNQFIWKQVGKHVCTYVQYIAG